MKRFADRLREARVTAGLTQEQLGFALGVTKSSVSAWENGRETPNFKLLPKMREMLRTSLDALIFGVAPASRKIGDPDEPYLPRDEAVTARDVRERALLLRYRGLSAKRRAALLELMRPSDAD